VELLQEESELWQEESELQAVELLQEESELWQEESELQAVELWQEEWHFNFLDSPFHFLLFCFAYSLSISSLNLLFGF